MNKILKTLSFGLIVSGIAVAHDNERHGGIFKANNSLPPTPDCVFKANNTLPPTPDSPFKANNTLPPTPDSPFKANNSLPPTPDYIFKAYNSLTPTPEMIGNTLSHSETVDFGAKRIARQQNAMLMRCFQMQRQHVRA